MSRQHLVRSVSRSITSLSFQFLSHLVSLGWVRLSNVEFFVTLISLGRIHPGRIIDGSPKYPFVKDMFILDYFLTVDSKILSIQNL